MSTHESKRAFEDLLARLSRRQRVRDVVWLAGRGAFAGAVAALLAAVVLVLIGGEGAREGLWVCAALLPCGALLGAAAGWLRRHDRLAAARALDRAASSEDRFASALDLSTHRRRNRVALVLSDALERVRGSTVEEAIPLQAPRELRWCPVPLIALAMLLWLAPRPSVHAEDVPAPEVSAEEWSALSENLREEMARLPEPETADEQELADSLRRLAELFEKNPSKKEALAEIARLQDALEKQRAALGAPNLSLRQAAAALQSSAALSALAAALQSGDYRQASQELRKLAQRLQENSMKLSAADFESMAADFERLSDEVKSSAELSQATQDCASAAASMNREKLAQSCNNLAKSLERNSESLCRSDRLCRSRSLLDDLKRRLNQCKGCSSSCSGKSCKACQGSGNSLVRKNGGRGGLRAGWGTAENWGGGRLSDDAEQRMPLLAETPENPGAESAISTVSPDERAASAQEYSERFAELVRKAEADLALETVPPAYREYLRRYFVSIKPSDDAADGKEGAGE